MGPKILGMRLLSAGHRLYNTLIDYFADGTFVCAEQDISRFFENFASQPTDP